jgi:hypothetical protein
MDSEFPGGCGGVTPKRSERRGLLLRLDCEDPVEHTVPER